MQRWIRSLRLPAVIGLVLLALTFTAAIAPRLFTAHDPDKTELTMRLRPPAWMEKGDPGHPLGTDQLGRDLLSRVIYGARTSLAIGFFAVIVSAVVGVPLGLLAGYIGGWFDTAVMWVVDVQLAIPFIMLSIAMVMILGPSFSNMVLALAATGWVRFTRLTRSKVLSLKELEYVTAARSLGARQVRLLFKHLLPNAINLVIVLGTLEIGRVVVMESTVSFLGLGIDAISWGKMLSETRSYISIAWWLATWPGLAIMLLVLAVNMVGDWLNDVLEPTLRP